MKEKREIKGSGRVLADAFHGLKSWGNGIITLTPEKEAELGVPNGTKWVYLEGSCQGFNSPIWITVKQIELKDGNTRRMSFQPDPLSEGVVSSISEKADKFYWRDQSDLAKFVDYLDRLASKI